MNHEIIPVRIQKIPKRLIEKEKNKKKIKQGKPKRYGSYNLSVKTPSIAALNYW